MNQSAGRQGRPPDQAARPPTRVGGGGVHAPAAEAAGDAADGRRRSERLAARAELSASQHREAAARVGGGQSIDALLGSGEAVLASQTEGRAKRARAKDGEASADVRRRTRKRGL